MAKFISLIRLNGSRKSIVVSVDTIKRIEYDKDDETTLVVFKDESEDDIWVTDSFNWITKQLTGE